MEPMLTVRLPQPAANGETPYAIGKALGGDRHTAAKYALGQSTLLVDLS
jgi:hypothetical protein